MPEPAMHPDLLRGPTNSPRARDIYEVLQLLFQMPEIVLFGDSLTEWSFSGGTQGFGFFLRQQYKDKELQFLFSYSISWALCLSTLFTPTSRQTCRAANMASTTVQAPLPEMVVFGASMAQWSFEEQTQGYGWFLEKMYTGKARVVNEGIDRSGVIQRPLGLFMLICLAGYTTSRIKSDFDRIITRATSPGATPTLLFTIFIGANDACIMGDTPIVPWSVFSDNIRTFLDTILTEQAMEDTKIVIITPPPINTTLVEKTEGSTAEDIEYMNAFRREGPRFKTYMNKKRYAEGIMQIADEYAETERVVGLNFWKDIVDAMLKEEGAEYDEDMPPGCGLLGSKNFPRGWFTDGLHLDIKGYSVLSKGLFELVTTKWPELAPEKL
ncbi:GDSL Lipase Acylhydrolase family [Pyrenophora seminiperda CCB06]|uniref:GDSL Lipase Acylhydrolase family n=1 Tax=Pyrenophora seminiperda CCB06 TaxID=1302712 RepID=A0A3M7ME70_9PLEO|nr:GDSL Lipase Acylhydrolase family [Pyrenophora seminiperda CCB06]